MERKKAIIAVLAVVGVMVVMVGVMYFNEQPRDPWVFIREHNGFRHLINEKTIKIQNNYLEFSLLSDKVVKDSAATHVILRMQVSPDGKRIRVLQGDTYYRDGKVESDASNKNWMSLPPDSVMAEAARYGWTKAK